MFSCHAAVVLEILISSRAMAPKGAFTKERLVGIGARAAVAAQKTMSDHEAAAFACEYPAA